MAFIFSNFVNAKDFNLSESIMVKASSEVVNESLRTQFSDQPKFSYFEEQSLGASSSVFLYGLDQRYFDVTLNGFHLSDPSTPLGAFNLSQIAGVYGLRVGDTNNLKTIKLETKTMESNFFTKGSQLLEYALGGTYGADNFDISASTSKSGGFNQSTFGTEKDYTFDYHLNFGYRFKYKNLKLDTSFFYTHQNQDYDVPLFETEQAYSKTETLLIGKKITYDNFKLFASYSLSDRVFKEERIFPDTDQQFSFKGESVQIKSMYKDKLSLLLLSEKTELSEDFSIKVFYENFNFSKNITMDSEIFWTEKRGLYFDSLLKIKNFFSIFYKELPPSLFQLEFNNTNFKPQKSIGAKIFRDFSIKSFDFRFETFYQRAFNQIEFDLNTSKYLNFEESENLFSSLTFAFEDLSFFVQALRAKNLVLNLDLPRRSKWVFGFNFEKNIKSLKLDLRLKWNSPRKAFDGSRLSSVWTSQFNIKYKGFTVSIDNVIDQKKPIIKNFSRRPLTFELLYSYNF